MKKLLSFFVFIGIISSLICDDSFSQGISTTWSTNNPFKTDVFVENLGQFDHWAKTPAPIKYAVNNSDMIFFYQQGLTIKLEKFKNISEEEYEEIERSGKIRESDTYFVNMQWEGCSKNTKIEVTEEAEGYYTFGNKGCSHIKAKGYKKLVYKELYPGINVEYIIPKEGGIKYSLIVYPGADISKVKMKYSGDVDIIETSIEGNIIIKTPAGNITDHAPESILKSTSEKISSSFKIVADVVSFEVEQSPNLKHNTIVIDPWTVTPSTLTTTDDAYDLDYDYSGNVYVSGGTYPFKLVKYNSSGTALWTFTNPFTSPHTSEFGVAGCYSKFCVIPQTGSVFIGEGSYNSPGPRVIKIAKDGSLAATYGGFTGTSEIWIMYFNRNTGQLIGFGGDAATGHYNNVQVFADTSLSSSTVKNFNGLTSGTGANPCCNDVAAVDMDINGDFYALMSSSSGYTTVSNQFQKSRYSTTPSYKSPVSFSKATTGWFKELYHTIPGFFYNGSSGFQTTVRANAIAVNSKFVFIYDGRVLSVRNKSNGSGVLIDSIEVYGGSKGKDRLYEGIDVDECNCVFVGDNAAVQWFSVDTNYIREGEVSDLNPPIIEGASFDHINDGVQADISTYNPNTPITSGITGQVYDIKLSQNNIIYVCGNGFVTKTSRSSCASGVLPITLLEFKAMPENGIVKLNWSTSSEINNNYFTIEKSIDGNNFTEVSRVDGANNSNLVRNYSELDKNPYQGISYYRLKQTDFDGKYTYSQIVTVNLNQSTNTLKLSFYPNPSNGDNLKIKIFSQKNSSITLTIFNIEGQLVLSNEFFTDETGFVVITRPDLPYLNPGIYFIKVNSADYSLIKKQIIIP